MATVLGNLLLNSPTVAKHIFQEVIHSTITSLHWLPVHISISQVVVIFKILKLPDCYTLKSCHEFTSQVRTKHFLQYTGVVIGLSTVHRYTKAVRYLCKDTICPGSRGDQYIRLHIPGAKETQTVRKDFSCVVCGGSLDEDVSSRELGEKLILEMVDENALRSSPLYPKRFQSISTYIRDDLIQQIDLGNIYTVLGTCVHDAETETVVFEANNIFQEIKQYPDVQGNISAVIPEAILALHKDRGSSPWSFGLSLAFAFGDSISPAGSYLHLKLGILLSLVGTLNDVPADRSLDILVIGSDSLVIQRLLQLASSFCSRSIIHNSGYHLTAAARQGKQQTGLNFFQGGSLLLARGGVCLLPNLNSMKKSEIDSLINVLDKGSVILGAPSLTGAGKQTAVLPVSCRVWAHLTPKSTGNFGILNNFTDFNKTPVDFGKTKQSLMDGFGMVYFANCDPGSYAECTTVHQTLLSAMGIQPASLITSEDFKQFLDQVQKRTVEFTTEAEHLIKGFYIASRRARSTGSLTSKLPQSAISTITSLAASHAKLHLRPLVMEEDAVMAILLYEESMINMTGFTVLNVQPLQHIKDNNLQQYIGTERDQQLRIFQVHLRSFISTHTMDMSTLSDI